MPALEVMTERGLELLDQFPAFMRDDPTVRAACHVRARETDYILAKLEEVRDGLIPVRTGPLMLEAWEAQTHLPRNPAELTTEQRRDAVLARLQSFVADPAGYLWIASLRAQLGTGWTYVEEELFLLRFTVPWPSGGERIAHARAVIEVERPAAWDFIVTPDTGFILDHSQLDKDTFHPS